MPIDWQAGSGSERGGLVPSRIEPDDSHMQGYKLSILASSCHTSQCLMYRAVILRLEDRVGKVDITLRGARAAMSEQLLQRGDRHGRFRHAPPESMTELMAGDLNAGFLAIFFQDKLDAVDGEPPAALGNENRPIVCDRAAGEPI